MAFDCGLSIGVVSGKEPINQPGQRAGIGGGAGRAIVGEPFDRHRQPVHQTGVAFDAFPIRSWMSLLLIPPLAAIQEIASRSQQLGANTIRTRPPLSQPISNPSERSRSTAAPARPHLPVRLPKAAPDANRRRRSRPARSVRRE
jgi:hypothetical protein